MMRKVFSSLGATKSLGRQLRPQFSVATGQQEPSKFFQDIKLFQQGQIPENLKYDRPLSTFS